MGGSSESTGVARCETSGAKATGERVGPGRAEGEDDAPASVLPASALLFHAGVETKRGVHAGRNRFRQLLTSTPASAAITNISTDNSLEGPRLQVRPMAHPDGPVVEPHLPSPRKLALRRCCRRAWQRLLQVSSTAPSLSDARYCHHEHLDPNVDIIFLETSVNDLMCVVCLQLLSPANKQERRQL
jgi:hypothetical protein